MCMCIHVCVCVNGTPPPPHPHTYTQPTTTSPPPVVDNHEYYTSRFFPPGPEADNLWVNLSSLNAQREIAHNISDEFRFFAVSHYCDTQTRCQIICLNYEVHHYIVGVVHNGQKELEQACCQKLIHRALGCLVFVLCAQCTCVVYVYMLDTTQNVGFCPHAVL